MCRSENSTLPEPPSAEERLKWFTKRALDNAEIARVTEFHSDTDVLLKLNKLRILGVYPTPDESDMNVVRAFLSGFAAGSKRAIHISRSGGIA